MRVLIIEDEIPAQRILTTMLNELEEDIDIIGCLDSVKSAVNWLNTNEYPDIIMLDIQLSDGISFEILKQVKTDSMIIFTTAFDEYAIQAFKVNSLDYLLKPIEKEELQQAFAKYKTYTQKFIHTKNTETDFSELITALQQPKNNYRKRFIIHANESFFYLPIIDVAYFYSMQKITFAVTFDKREYPVDFSLESLKEQLHPDQFFKINRQFIINIETIKRVHSYFQGKLVLETEPVSKEKIIVGKDKAARFRRWMDR